MSPPTEGPFDAGLQAERTALAWRRTALAMAAAAVGAGRLAAPVLGLASLVIAAIGVVEAVLVAESARRRYRRVRESLAHRGALTAVRLAGLPMAAMACSGVLVGLLALAFVLAH